MIEWTTVSGSTRIVAEAYDSENERILVRFTDGAEHWYGSCPPHVWEQFTAPGQSRGRFIRQELDHKPHGPLDG